MITINSIVLDNKQVPRKTGTYDLDLFQMNYELENITTGNHADKVNEERAAKERYNDKIIANRRQLIDLITHADSKEGLSYMRNDLKTRSIEEQRQRQVNLFESF